VFNEAGVLVYNEDASMGNRTGTQWETYSRIIGLDVGRYVHIIHQVGAAGGDGFMDNVTVITS